MTKNIFLKFIIPAIAVLLLAKTLIGFSKNPQRKENEVEKPVTISAFEKNISGLGVSEPRSEIIEIGTDISGIVAQVFVEAGAQVKKGDNLFVMDEREAKANLQLKISNEKAAQLDLLQKHQELEMYKSVKDSGAYSRDEFNKKEIAEKIAQQRFEQAQAEREIAQVALDKLTIKAPIDGEILSVDVRVGEFAQAGINTSPLMRIGDMSQMHVRVEIDESDAHLLNVENEAVAFLRGDPSFKIPLKFVRVEPYILPKVSLSGIGEEKVDTRVLQVIYSFENSAARKIFAGQQLDIYIKI